VKGIEVNGDKLWRVSEGCEVKGSEVNGDKLWRGNEGCEVVLK
jgi:hypothetical protein